MELVIDMGDKVEKLVREVRDRLLSDVPGLRFTRATKLVRRYIRKRLMEGLTSDAAWIARPLDALGDVAHCTPADLMDAARKTAGNAPR